MRTRQAGGLVTLVLLLWACSRKTVSLTAALLLATGVTQPALGFGLFTHEAIIEISWKQRIEPLLVKHSLNATPEQLQEARKYAYGGAIIQDLGYFPHSNEFCSDLLHYVRSGDFIQELFRQSSDLYEYAFALGALEHYVADTTGHPLATNPAVAIYNPQLRAKYGDAVTYEQSKVAHSQAELGFDVVDMAGKLYRWDIFSELIAFAVPTSLLERAFTQTYGLALKDLFPEHDLARSIRVYQRVLSDLYPRLAMVAGRLKRREILAQHPHLAEKDFLYPRSMPKEKREEMGRHYQEPKFLDKGITVLVRVPFKLGLFKSLDFDVPTPETEKLFVESMGVMRDSYQRLLGDIDTGRLALTNLNFDTGRPTRPGEYALADHTYAKLLDTLAKENFKG
ncbi:MAG TPA: zinc dependent phospholipase C family protein, partial [Candidatus Binatia bacterium]|nr:zinc dependent phospholipase C family protein [Candidatus Binatia bacterium]